MNTIKNISLTAILGGLLAACGGDDGARGDGESGDADSSGGETSGATMTSTTMTSTTMTSTTMTSTTLTTTDPSETDTDPDTTGGDDGFEFEDNDPAEYSQVDRMGMPAVATAVITDKDDYNQATPGDDAAGDFVEQIVANLTGLHAALDDDLMGAGLTPCDIDTCVAQGAPLVVPDVLRVDFTMPSGFPNGRLPADPVVDITLAVVLLDLSVHDVTVLADLPLNPPEGDSIPSDEFPYFAEPF